MPAGYNAISHAEKTSDSSRDSLRYLFGLSWVLFPNHSVKSSSMLPLARRIASRGSTLPYAPFSRLPRDDLSQFGLRRLARRRCCRSRSYRHDAPAKAFPKPQLIEQVKKVSSKWI